MSPLPANGSSAGRTTVQPLGIELPHVARGQRAILAIARPRLTGGMHGKKNGGDRNFLTSSVAPNILQLAASTVAPIVPLALTMMPLEELLKTLFGILF